MRRVLLLIEQRANADLLTEYLRQCHEVLIGGEEQSLNTPFDLAVIDGPTLDRLGKAIRQRRAAEQPLFLPVLLLTSRRDIGLATQQLWHSVDDLIQTPIQKLELQARVEVMLRARELSRINYSIVVAAGEGILRVEPDGRVLAAHCGGNQSYEHHHRKPAAALTHDAGRVGALPGGSKHAGRIGRGGDRAPIPGPHSRLSCHRGPCGRGGHPPGPDAAGKPAGQRLESDSAHGVARP